MHRLEQVRRRARGSAQKFVTLPCAKCASTSRGCTVPRSRTNSNTRSSLAPVPAPRRRILEDASATHAAAEEPRVNEVILVDVERGVEPLEIRGAVICDAMTEHKVLRARRRANRNSLHEPERVDRVLKGVGGKRLRATASWRR